MDKGGDCMSRTRPPSVRALIGLESIPLIGTFWFDAPLWIQVVFMILMCVFALTWLFFWGLQCYSRYQDDVSRRKMEEKLIEGLEYNGKKVSAKHLFDGLVKYFGCREQLNTIDNVCDIEVDCQGKRHCNSKGNIINFKISRNKSKN